MKVTLAHRLTPLSFTFDCINVKVVDNVIYATGVANCNFPETMAAYNESTDASCFKAAKGYFTVSIRG